MSAFRALHAPICLPCRLRASIAAKRFARSRKVVFPRDSSRPFTSNSVRLNAPEPDSKERVSQQRSITDILHPRSSTNASHPLTAEDAALNARKKWGDVLPDGELNEEEYRVYERLYGKPVKFAEDSAQGLDEEMLDKELLMGTGVLKEADDGVLEEVEFEIEDDDDGGLVLEEGYQQRGADLRLADDIDASFSGRHDESDLVEEDSEDSYQRTHPFTLANRFSTSPSTVSIPPDAMLAPIEAQLRGVSNTHLSQAAHRLFGGVGLPYSTSTPAHGKTMQQKPIALEAGQSAMSPMEGDVFMAVLVPGLYASIMSILTETRKRLGTAWAERLVKKAETGELRILDAGGAGAGVLAVREMLRAEWERMYRDDATFGSIIAVAEADGKVGGASLTPPLGHGTVLTSSDTLRKRASLLLDNTTFVPRLPDYLHTDQAGKKGKFDIVIAPHTLWGLREDHLRKSHVRNLWSMVSQDGGVLVLLEKGVARGFEVVAAARELLLEEFVADNLHPTSTRRETGMIIAPCTTHSSCPMYQPKGMLKGRRDICHFSQRYTRPPFLQHILGARDKNFEDVKFSYLSIMRGLSPSNIEQDATTADLALRGYENADQPPSSLNLPRTVLPPLKRHGHVILDLCTPAGTLERWTVPKSFSKQAYRDARKSSWGDLWALGAKTRVLRTPSVKKRKSNADLDVKLASGKKGKGRAKSKGKRDSLVDYDGHGRIVVKNKTDLGESE